MGVRKMKIKGKVVRHEDRGQIVVETDDGYQYVLPRFAASSMRADGSVEFEVFGETPVIPDEY